MGSEQAHAINNNMTHIPGHRHAALTPPHTPATTAPAVDGEARCVAGAHVDRACVSPSRGRCPLPPTGALYGTLAGAPSTRVANAGQMPWGASERLTVLARTFGRISPERLAKANVWQSESQTFALLYLWSVSDFQTFTERLAVPNVRSPERLVPHVWQCSALPRSRRPAMVDLLTFSEVCVC